MSNNESAAGGLSPCPFCGSPARLSFGDEVVNVRCLRWGSGCLGAGPNEFNEADARAGWNRRAPAPGATPSPACDVQSAEPATFMDQIDGEREAAAWLDAMVPKDRYRVFWTLDRKSFAEPSEGGSVRVLRCNDRAVAAAICIRDVHNRTTLLRWIVGEPRYLPNTAPPQSAEPASEREAFEAWAADEFANGQTVPHNCWLGWQARAALATPPAPPADGAANTLGVSPGGAGLSAPALRASAAIPDASGNGLSTNSTTEN